jgi:hypothetical protein
MAIDCIRWLMVWIIRYVMFGGLLFRGRVFVEGFKVDIILVKEMFVMANAV